MPREHTGHSKHPLPTTQEKTLTWTSPNGQHRNQIDIILCSQRWRSSIHSAKTRLGADCGSDHELLIAKFRLILKKVGKTNRPFRYDLNQIPYDFTVEVRNRFFSGHKWTSPHGKHRNQIDCILCSQRWRSSIQSAKTRPEADCGSDHELLIAKFRLKLKKVEEQVIRCTFGYTSRNE